MRLLPLLFAIYLTLACSAANAGERRFALHGLDNQWAVLNEPSPLQPTGSDISVDEPATGYVQFSGKLDLRVDWRMLPADHPDITGTGDAVEPGLVLYVRPDSHTGKHLPYPYGSLDAYGRPSRTIAAEQLLSLGEYAQIFAEALTTPAQREALASGRIAELKGNAAVRIDRVQAGIECDAWQLSARLLQVRRLEPLPQIFADAEIVPPDGC